MGLFINIKVIPNKIKIVEQFSIFVTKLMRYHITMGFQWRIQFFSYERELTDTGGTDLTYF